MDRVRRDLITAGAALLGSQVAGVGGAAEAPFRNGRTVTKKQEDMAMAGQRANGHYTCVRTLESNEGPYYYESSQRRGNITEGKKGVPVKLRILVANALVPGNTCSALPGAVVDLWQADADGQYSNVGTDLQHVDTVGQTYLRGHQLTDAAGYVEFETIVPGWELVSVPAPQNVVIRATHIHARIFHEHQVTTTQLYFPDDYLDELYANVDPYRTHRKMTAPGAVGEFDRLRNTQDSAFVEDQSKPLQIKRVPGGIAAEATIGLVTLGSRGFAPLFR
jgi:protocatechuate 3,4-dioxygenase beta subunit